MSTSQGDALTDRAYIEVEPGCRLPYVAAGDPEAPTVVLLHGFPQTSYEWRKVIPGLVRAGYHTLAPDLRGIGGRWIQGDRYDKVSLASDIRRLIEALGIVRPISIVGHDIGLMVGYAYAQTHRADVSHLTIIDALLPGTEIFDTMRSDPRLWHFDFHAVQALPELLVRGKERDYLRYFFSRTSDASAISPEDFEVYVSAYSEPGAMHAGFEFYRAFQHDADVNRHLLTRHGKLSIPVLAVGGETSISGPLVLDMMLEVADDVTGVRLAGTAHWIPEEAPEALVAHLLDFMT